MSTPPAILADPTAAAPPVDARRQARSLYWRGWGIQEIADELALKRPTVASWQRREKWDDTPMVRRLEESVEVRYQALVAKEKKSGADLKELDALGRQCLTLARIRRFEEEDGHTGHLNDKVANRNAGPKKRPAPANYFTADQVAELRRIFEEEMFDYNRTWEAAKVHRNRKILKSRQIGATFHFAREALLDALEGPTEAIDEDGPYRLGGGNQIFLSASKNQARQFRSYIVEFAGRVGVKLSGDPIVVSSELMPADEPTAELYFLGTNSKTAQSYHGNFYFDEFFWVAGFEKLNKVATAMATHKRWRRTWMSTPSSIVHEAHPYWTGERRNRRRKGADRIKIDVSHQALCAGALGPDLIWRHIVTVEDAAAGGCRLFRIAELRDEYAADEFANLFMCDFVDDSLSAFRFNDLIACGVDSMVMWRDVNMEAARPYTGEVWAGYDPQESEDGDTASLVVAAPPAKPGGKFRILERHPLRGLDFADQAAFIERILSRYRCTYLGVDATGVGAAVYQLLRDRLKGTRVVSLAYDLALKAVMVMKAQNVIARGRLEFDVGMVDLISSFVAIKKTATTSGRNLTFKAGRTVVDGHADLAWATMHILINEPLDGEQRQQTTMEIIG